MLVMEQGGKAEVAIDAANGTIDSMTKTAVFFPLHTGFLCKMVEEQWYIDHYFINSRGRDLRCLNNGFVSARWVSRHTGRDVNCEKRFDITLRAQSAGGSYVAGLQQRRFIFKPKKLFAITTFVKI